MRGRTVWAERALRARIGRRSRDRMQQVTHRTPAGQSALARRDRHPLGTLPSPTQRAQRTSSTAPCPIPICPVAAVALPKL